MFGLFALFSTGGESLWERIVAWYQNSLIHELLNYANERYFTVEFGLYENFSLGANAGTTSRNLILGFAIGIIIASILTAYVRIGLGAFVRKLLKTESVSPEQAKTLLELGYFRSTVIRRELTQGTTLRTVVRSCEDDMQEAEGDENGEEQAPAEAKKAHTLLQKPKKIDFLTARFYVPEDLRYRADVRFEKKGSGWGSVILSVLITVVVSAALCWLLPDLFQFADNIITVFAPK